MEVNTISLSTEKQLDGEEWKRIVDFPNYDISSFGRVRSFTPIGGRQKERFRLDDFRILKGGLDKDGYRRFLLCKNENGTRTVKSIKFYELVSFYWIGPKPKGLVITHKDGNKNNDCADNLEYKTQKENIHDKFTHGTMPLGEESNLASISNELAKLIKIDLANGERQSEVAKNRGVSKSLVWAIKHNKTWRHIEI